MRPLRVLHCPTAVGGHPGNLARAERELGLQSLAVSLEPNLYGYEVDEVLRRPGEGRARFEARRWTLVLRALREFDVVHFNFGRTILPPYPALEHPVAGARAYAALTKLLDLRALRLARKGVVVTFQGDDARQGATSGATEIRGPRSDAARRRMIAAFDRHAHRIYYLNPDLARVLPVRAEFLPYASVDLHAWRQVAPIAGRLPLVVHAPSEREVKGTRHVLAAVEKLRIAGVAFRFELVEGITREAARALYELADIVVDQLLLGWYGGVAVEAMALGKPVVCFVEEADLDVVPAEMRAALPVVNADPASLADVLRSLIERPSSERRDLGARGRAYVEHWHNPLKIAERLSRDYATIVRTASPRLHATNREP